MKWLDDTVRVLLMSDNKERRRRRTNAPIIVHAANSANQRDDNDWQYGLGKQKLILAVHGSTSSTAPLS